MSKIPKVILLMEASGSYSRNLLCGIAKYCRLHGPWRCCKAPPFYMGLNAMEKMLSRLKDWNADGIIAREPKKVIDKLIEMDLPTIVSPNVIEQYPVWPALITDSVAIGKMAAEHLLDRGFQQFAHCGFDQMLWSQKRGEGFRKRIVEAGFETHFYKQPKRRAMRSWEKEQTIMVDWLISLPKPIGLMACNDDRGQNVIDSCKIAGLHVPEEVAVIGVDNDDLVCDLSDPPLSSIALNTERAGYETAELLDKLMAGEKMVGQRLIDPPTHIATRQSTDILAIEDSDVVEAMRFIRQHSKEMIQVSDVVDMVAVSRRCLEQRFRKIIGRSIHDEISRIRVEQVARMLVETNLSVSQIALALGYPNTENIARYFRQEKGLSPLAYRKQYGHK